VARLSLRGAAHNCGRASSRAKVALDVRSGARPRRGSGSRNVPGPRLT